MILPQPSDRPTVLFVDDDEEILRSLANRAMHSSFEVLTATNIEEATKKLKSSKISVLVVDARLSDRAVDSMTLLERARMVSPSANLVLLTEYLPADEYARLERINGFTLSKEDSIDWIEELLRAPLRLPGLLTADGEPVAPPVGIQHEPPSPSRELIVSVESASAELVRVLSRSPELVSRLSPRQFEEAVAEILARFGYEVTITPPVADGGLDIFAARRDALGRFLFLVECKRYIPPHKVGVRIVREITGVLDQHRANGAMVVTSSYFTAGARRIESEMQHRLKLHDYFAVRAWLESFRKS